MKKLLILNLLLAGCNSYHHYAHKTRNSTWQFTMGDTVKVRSPFEKAAYFLVTEPPDERGRIRVWDLQNGWYVLLSERGVEK